MSTPTPTQGLQNARSPGSIANAEHHDFTGVGKQASGLLVSIDRIIADSSVAAGEAVGDFAPMWVVNRDAAAVHYLYVGKEPAPGTVDATNGIALPPNFAGMVFGPASDDPMKSIMVKSDDSDVHITVMTKR